MSDIKNHWLFRGVAAILAEVLILTSVPVPPASTDPAPVAATVLDADPVPESTPPPPPQVTVNKTVPTVTPVPLVPVFSSQPTDAEIFRARVFGEPFVPTGPTTADENKALALAILAYVTNGNNEDVTPLGTFLDQYPRSAWRASLLTNLGSHYQRKGYFTRSQGVLTEAWALTRTSADPIVQAVAGRALTELLDLHMRFGRAAELEEIVVESEELELHGGASDKVAEARRAVHVLRDAHHEAIASAAMAVDRYQGYGKQGYSQHSEVAKFMPKEEGASLAEVKDLAGRTGESMRMVKAPANLVDFPVPSIVHLKQGHFTALVKQEGNRYLLADPILGSDEFWISRAALQEEASGYFVIPEGPLPPGFTSVRSDDVQQVRGKCLASIRSKFPPRCDGTSGGCNGHGCTGAWMAVYTFNSFLATLIITDRPVGHTPPRGPSVDFSVRYDHAEASQPQIFSFPNVGKKWRVAWLAYIEDDPSNPNATVYLYPPAGGQQTFSGFNGSSYARDVDSRAVLVRTSSSPIQYEKQFPDGGVEVYTQSDGAVSPRRVFLTQRRDPQGNALTFTYDSSLRLVSVTDAIGQVTALSYELTSDPLKITKVTDPFGRAAKLEYDATGALVKITDVIGIVSEFEYGQSDFVRALTTPYGTTTFAYGNANTQGYYWDWWLEATDPLGAKERIEYVWGTTAIPATEPSSVVPLGFVNNADLNSLNTFYWDKRAMMLYPADYTKAHIKRWLNSPTSGMVVEASLHSQKKPLENRVWYGQVGQSIANGTSPQGRPAKIGRVLDDGTSQITRSEWSAKGKLIRATDPLGRETVYVYGTGSTPDADQAHGSGMDLLQVKQRNPASAGGYDLLSSATYNAQHLPLTQTDAAGQTTTSTYNSAAQLLTVTTPPRAGITENRTTIWAYDTNGNLESVTSPATGATTTYTYDGYGRVRTVTDSDSYTLTFDYDALDRPTRITYPDGTYQETVHNRLDPERRRDRLGRWTQIVYDALRRPVIARDPLGRATTNQWCNCGSLDKLIDPNGNATTWERDLQGRPTRVIRANGSDATATYENTTSRVKEIRDARQQVTAIQYFADNNWKQVTYTNAQVPTPTVSFNYDTSYNRLVSIVDGTGTTSYAYNSVITPPTLGAARLASVDGPLSNDVITYNYDELGRVTGRSINGIALSQSFDALGRATGETNALGSFTYGYDGVTDRLTSVSYPNGQTTTLAYLPNSQDHRLQDIHNKLSGGATLSRFQYTYDAEGTIKTWTQQADASPAKVYDLDHDAADELVAATSRTTDPTPTILKRYRYAYDPGGNRTTEQIDDASTAASHDTLNAVTGLQPGGALLFKGSVNEPATVTVAGRSATVDASNKFQGAASAPSGTSNVAVVATDPAGNVRANTYQVTQSGSSKILTYDANGNLTSDGARIFEWDAVDRLTASVQGTQRSEFTYDGWGHRIRVVEKTSGVVTSDQRFLWCGWSICEERDASGATVLRRFYGQGTQESSTNFFYTRDHLGSIREMTDSTGAIRARYDYDPYGRVTKSSGDKESLFTFTGHLGHATSGLALAPLRAYDPSLGRWTSQDPIGFAGGPNLYAYVGGRPLDHSDPMGLEAVTLTLGGLAGLGGATGGAAGIAGVAGATVGTAGIGAAVIITGAGIAWIWNNAQEDIIENPPPITVPPWNPPPPWEPPSGTRPSPPSPPTPVPMPPVNPTNPTGDNEQSAASRGRQRNEYNDSARARCGDDKECICELLKCWYEEARKNGDTQAAQKIKTAQKADNCRGHR